MYAKLPNGAGCKADDVKYIQVRTDQRSVRGQRVSVSQILVRLDGEESAIPIGAYETREGAEEAASEAMEAVNGAADEAALSGVGSGAAVKAGVVKYLKIKGERTGQGAMYSVECCIESEQPFTINTFADHDALIDPIAELKPHIGLLTTHPDEGEFPFFAGSVETALKLGLEAAVPSHYSCFTTRDFDPQPWAEMFPEQGPEPVIIPYDGSVIYPA